MTDVRGAGTANGYRMVTVDGQRMYEHRYVMGQVLGRPLETHEHVHHVNEVKTDNRPENLQVVGIAEHNALHRGRVLNGTQAAVVALRGEGLSQSEIASRLGLNQSTVSRHLRAAAGRPRPRWCPKGAQ